MKHIKKILILLFFLCCTLIGNNTVYATTNDTTFVFAFIETPDSVKATKEYLFATNAPDSTQVQYSVSDTKYATITDNGILKGKQVGTVIVSASYNNQTIQCEVAIKGKKTIYIDAGHQRYAGGGTEPIGPGSSTRKAKMTGGATGVATGVPEYKFNLTIAKKLRTALLKKGYGVVMSRTKHDVKISNVERAKKGNKSGADICIRIHADSFSNSSATGASVLYASTSNPYWAKKYAKKSKKLAQKLLDEYCDATGIYKRGIVVRNDLTGTNWSKMPTVLIECGFFSNPSEDRKLNKSSFQKKMVKGMVNGIDSYFGFE